MVVVLKEVYKYMQLGNIIKITKQKAFLSQEVFANELDVSVSTINRWEIGKVKPNLSAMKKIKTFCDNHNLPYEEIEKEWFMVSENN